MSVPTVPVFGVPDRVTGVVAVWGVTAPLATLLPAGVGAGVGVGVFEYAVGLEIELTAGAAAVWGLK